MVRNRAAIALIIVGIVLALAEMSIPRVAAVLYPPTPSPGPFGRPSTDADVPVIWREFREGIRSTGLGTTVRVCAAALERGAGKSALVIRFCDPVPRTPERRFAFGFDDLVIHAQLPGGVALAYDLLDYETTREGAARFSERPLGSNDAPIASVRVEDVTDVVFVLARELPIGLPAIEVTARFEGNDVRDAVAFAPLAGDLARAEAARVAISPDWARAHY